MQIFHRGRNIAAGIFIFMIAIPYGCGQQSTTGGPPPAGPPEVAVVSIQPKRLIITTELAGRTSASIVADVRPQVGGIVQKRLFTEGADVKAGQTLYQIDPAPYKTALDNARAALIRSEASLPAIRSKADRVRALLADRAVSRQDYDDVTAALKQAEADIQYWKTMVEAARINLGYTTVKAPISGRIGRSNITEGALVTAYQPIALATIQQLDPVYVDVPQSTTALLRLRRRLDEGRLHRNGRDPDKVSLVLEDGSKYPWEGMLQFRDVTVDPSTGSVILRVVVPNPKGLLLPGMFVRAVVEEGVNRQAILVPQQSVSRTPKGTPMALIVDKEGKVQQRQLVLDRTIGNHWLVSSGLSAGERVIVEGMIKVKPGISVKVVPFTDGNKKTGSERGRTASPSSKRN